MAQLKELKTPKNNIKNLMKFIHKMPSNITHTLYYTKKTPMLLPPPPPPHTHTDKHNNHVKLRNYEPTKLRNNITNELQLELYMKPWSPPSKRKTLNCNMANYDHCQMNGLIFMLVTKQ